MNATTVAVDLAKNVFELAVADENWRVIARHRLSRAQFERWFANRNVSLIVMEACGSAHYWARTFAALGIEVRLLPAHYVSKYVKRNKTDAADAVALLEAARANDMKPVRVKSVEQQALQALHRTRSGWMSTRTRRINTLRGFCREFGLVVPPGADTGLAQIARYVADPQSAVPSIIRGSMRLIIEEIRLLEARIQQLEHELTTIATNNAACQALLSVPGIGLLTSTARWPQSGIRAASIPGDTMRASSGSHPANVRQVKSATSAVSRNAATGTSEHYSLMVRVQYCERPPLPDAQVVNSID